MCPLSFLLDHYVFDFILNNNRMQYYLRFVVITVMFTSRDIATFRLSGAMTTRD